MVSVISIEEYINFPRQPSDVEACEPSYTAFEKTEEIACKLFQKVIPSLCLNIGTMAGLTVVPLNTLAVSAALVFCSTIYVIQRCIENSSSISETVKLENYMNKLSQFSLVSWVGQAAPQILIHEMGHALAALATLKDVKLELAYFSPFHGGMLLTHSQKGLTEFGKLLGTRGSQMLVVAGGVMASTMTAMGMIGFSSMIQENHPQLSEYLNMYAASTVLTELCYGFISLCDPLILSDFSLLQELGGVHPLFAMMLIAGAPWILYRSLS